MPRYLNVLNYESGGRKFRRFNFRLLVAEEGQLPEEAAEESALIVRNVDGASPPHYWLRRSGLPKVGKYE